MIFQRDFSTPKFTRLKALHQEAVEALEELAVTIIKESQRRREPPDNHIALHNSQGLPSITAFIGSLFDIVVLGFLFVLILQDILALSTLIYRNYGKRLKC